MKKNLQIFLFLLVALSFAQFESEAQLTLIHYWNFNCTVPLGGGGKTHFGPHAIAPDYTILNSANPSVTYEAMPGVKIDTGYIDNVAGDTLNQRACCLSNCTGDQAGIRTRNPSDSMEFIWNIPTTGYKNIVLTWEVQSSSTTAGMLTILYSYSIDGGTNFITTGLPRIVDSTVVKAIDTLLPTPNWELKSLNLTGIAGVDNNPNLVFKILFGTYNTGSSGNNRWDNITMEGNIDTSTGIQEVNANANYSVYPNPVSDNLNITTATAGTKTVTIYNSIGQQVIVTQLTGMNLSVNTSNLSGGIYCVNIRDNNSQNSSTLKFVKN